MTLPGPAVLRLGIFDTETSGLVANRTLPIDKQPDIIEFYGEVVEFFEDGQYRVWARCEHLIKPRRNVSEEITKITKITNDMLKDASPFAAVAADIKSFLELTPTVLAHNLSFDQDMLELEFSRIGETIYWPPRLCSVEQTVHLKGYRLKLSDLHEHLFGEPFAGAHRARVDVEALTKCCGELVKRGQL